MRRTSPKMAACRPTRWRSARLPIRKPEFFAFKRHGFKVENSVMRHSHLETICMSDEPVDSITAIAGPGDSRVLRIRVRQLNHGIKHCCHIDDRLAAPVLRHVID